MTVAELIAELQKLPSDIVVVAYNHDYSEYYEAGKPIVVEVLPKGKILGHYRFDAAEGDKNTIQAVLVR